MIIICIVALWISSVAGFFPQASIPVRQHLLFAAKNTSTKHKSNRHGPRARLKNEGPKRKDETLPRPISTDYEENTSPKIVSHRKKGVINCIHFEECSGCSVKENVADTNVIQSATSFFSSPWIRQKLVRRPRKDGGAFFKVEIPSPLTEWRTQAKLAAAPRSTTWAKDGLKFGLYRQRSHQVVSIPDCAVHHPAINRAVEVLEQATIKAGTSAYDEASREGGLRYIQLQVNRYSGKICLTLVWNAEKIKDAQPALSRLLKELRNDPGLWHSVWLNCNDGIGNNIIARSPQRWHRL